VSAEVEVEVADESAIRRLSVRYAVATDAICRGGKADALGAYNLIFTPDAVVAAGFDAGSPQLVASGPAEWADVVEAAFVDYSATQHLLGSIDVVFEGADTARMTSYLTASHVFAAPSTDVMTVLGTYVDAVERRAEGWRIVHRFLQFTAFSSAPRIAP
jgi:hypothetical protein